MEESMKDPKNMKFITISESCIPYQSFDNFYNFLKKDNIKTSYIKSLPIKSYDWKERIKKQKNYKDIKHWRKHLARFCLSRYHVQILLQKKEELKLFYKMHVADESEDKPSWMGTVDFSELKLKLVASIVTISGINLLAAFMDLSQVSDREIFWMVAVHIVFILSGVLLALMDLVTSKSKSI